MTGAYRLTAAAQADLNNAAAYYATKSPDVAKRFLLAATATFERVAEHPLHAPEIIPGAYRRVMRGYPFNVWYQPRDYGALVFAVWNQRRHESGAVVRALGLKP